MFNDSHVSIFTVSPQRYVWLYLLTMTIPEVAEISIVRDDKFSDLIVNLLPGDIIFIKVYGPQWLMRSLSQLQKRGWKQL